MEFCNYCNDDAIVQKKLDGLLKTIFSNVDQITLLKDIFKCFANKYFENINLTISVLLQSYVFGSDKSFEVPGKIFSKTTNSNLQPILANLVRINDLSTFLVKIRNSVQIEHILKGSNFRILIHNNFRTDTITSILKIEENFIYITSKNEKFYIKKQNILHYLVLKEIFSFINKLNSELTIIELLKQIENLKIYNRLLDDIFKLFFVRNSQLGLFKSRNLNESEYCNVKTIKNEEGSKFICENSELRKILNILGASIQIRLYKCENRVATINLLKYNEHIKEISYKLDILKSEVFYKSVPIFEDSSLIVEYSKIDLSSSEDDSYTLNYQANTKRKIRIKKKIESDKFILHNVVSSKKFEKECLVSALLSNIVAIAKYNLAFGHVENTNSIIHEYKLNNFELNTELNLIRRTKLYSKKMELIFKKFRYKEIENISSDSMVKRIRNIAGYGFEVSSVMQIIEEFICLIETQPFINYNEEIITKLLRERSCLFLEQYKSGHCKMVAVLDLILNLNLGNEMCKYIINIIGRIVPLSNINFYEKVGYYSFLNIMAESMRILKSMLPHTDIITVRKFLINTLPFDDSKIQSVLNKIIKFKELNQKNVTSTLKFKDITSFENYFEKPSVNYFRRINNFIQNFTNLVNLTNNKNSEYYGNHLFITEPGTIIANIINNNNVPFLKLEKYLYILNLHLVYIITELITPTFFNQEYLCKNYTSIFFPANPEKYLSLLKFISVRSPILKSLLYKNIYEKNVEVWPFLDKIMKLEIASILSVTQKKDLFTTVLLMDYLNQNDLNSSKDLLLKYLAYNQIKESNPNEFNVLLSTFASELIYNDVKYILLLESISTIKEKCVLLIENYRAVDDCDALCELLNSILLDRDVKKLNDIIISKITLVKTEFDIYYKLFKSLNLKTWKEVYNLEKSKPIEIFESLILSKKFELLKQWGKFIGVYKNISNEKFVQINMENLVDNDKKYISELLEVMENFPMDFVNSITKNKLIKFNNLNLIFNTFKNFAENPEVYFRNYKISLKILGIMKKSNLEVNLNMLNKPLLLIEQLIMNSKFQLLSEILKETDDLLSKQTCKYCIDKIENKSFIVLNPTLNNETTSEFRTNSDFILLNFNLHMEDHILTRSCIDFLLRIYASKALNFQISNKSFNFFETVYISINDISVDSLTNSFKIPKIAPNKNEWIKDENTTTCQSCRYTVFTMLIRRHHCRRCGRVVCYACSKHRMKIPELYQDVNVRVCVDCVKEFEIRDDKLNKKKSRIEYIETNNNCENLLKWELNGNLTHDKTLREQFSYEHACDVALCLTILSLHKNKDKCNGLLLYHCKKLKDILAFKNREIDLNFIANTLSCLSLAAKLRGGPSECDAVREHADIIKSFTKNDCENFMIPQVVNEKTVKKLVYNLVKVEKWSLALDISFKYGISKSNVLAAHGLLFLKSGCLELARERFKYCMTSVCSFTEEELIFEAVMSSSIINIENFKVINRPKRSPPLLSEIIRFIESTDNMLLLSQKERETNFLHNSKTSYSFTQILTSTKYTCANEKAFIVINTLSSLKSISNNFNFSANKIINTKLEIFKECFYYTTRYGTHTDIIKLLMRYKYIKAVLQYFVLQELKNEYFVTNIFLKFLKIGEVTILVNHMLDLDKYLSIWKNVFNCICKYLESKFLYNSLYQIQILLKDPVRASMTCIKFFLRDCSTFKQLNDNFGHLDSAQKHLEAEIELFQNWEDINFDRTINTETSFPIQLDYKSLNAYLNTILLQKDVTKFLAKYEEVPLYIVNQISELQNMNSSQQCLPSLFGSTDEKINIAVFILVLGRTLNDGFGLSYRIIQEYKLTPIKVYSKTLHFLVANNRVEDVFKLFDCIVTNNNTEKSAKEIDQIIFDVIKNYTKYPSLCLKKLKALIKIVNNVEIQISCYINLEELENAYLLAIQHRRIDQVKIISERAKQLNRFDIEKLCEKKLKIIT